MNIEVNAPLLTRLAAIAREAGAAIMRVYETDFAVRGKDDASPVTAADECAEACILAALAALTPGVPVVSEEAASAGYVPEFGRCFWLVDPLDGTKEFIERNGQFTVNIALVENGFPVIGVVYAPALNRLFGGMRGAGAYVEDMLGRRTIACRSVPAAGLDVMTSRSHGDALTLEAYLTGRRVNSVRSAGSSLKLCAIAAGEADLYPRLGRTMEWDTAAGHAVLAAAGGYVHTLQGSELTYGKVGLDNPPFVACGIKAT
jgi:3'(2'), 5'-bisphosphate nucleotidase